jgi:hypothetical protein
MTPEQFCYWLQGYFEINQDLPTFGEKEITVVQGHLQKVFNQNQVVNRNVNKPMEINDGELLCYLY